MKGYLTDREYSRIYSAVPRICVDLIIKTDNGVYLTKRNIPPYKGKYHLPGGRVRFRESINIAINRIAKEEVGIKVKVLHCIGYMEFTRETQNGQKRHSISLAFVVKPAHRIIVDSYHEKKIHPVHYKFLKEHKLI